MLGGVWSRAIAVLVSGALFFSPPVRSMNFPEGARLDGTALTALSEPGEIVVLVFVASDCPISRRYLPEISRLAQQYAGKKVRFWMVYPNPQENAATVQEQLHAFRVDLPALLDPEQNLVSRWHAQVTPEAVVLVPSPGAPGYHEVYRGRIDDRYISFGHEKPAATRHDLELALEDALAGTPIPPAEGHPIGCTIIPLSAMR